MAISFSNLLQYVNDSPTTSNVTGSITPSSNKLLLLSVAQYRSAGVPSTPTITAHGMTWDTVYDLADANRRLTVYRAMGSPSAGTVTIAVTNAPTRLTAIYDEVDGVTLGNNGSDAIRQVVGESLASGTYTGASITIPFTLKESTNYAYGIIHKNATNIPTVGSGFTKLGESNGTGSHLMTDYKTDTRTVNWTWSSEGSLLPMYFALELQQNKSPIRTLNTIQTGDGVSSKSFSYTPPTGAYLTIVRVFWRGVSSSQTISSATYGGTAMTSVVSKAGQSSQNPSVAVYSVANPASGASTIAISFSGSVNTGISVESWTNVDVQVKDTASNWQSATTAPSITLGSTLARGEIAYDVWATNNTRTWTAGTNEYYDFRDTPIGTTNSGKFTAAYKGVSGDTTVSHTISSSADITGATYTIQEVPVTVTFTPTIYMFS